MAEALAAVESALNEVQKDLDVATGSTVSASNLEAIETGSGESASSSTEASATATSSSPAVDPRKITEWKKYYDLETIEKFVDYLAETHDFVSLETLPERTFENRTMRVVKVCKSGCGSKKAVWINGGIHPR